MLQPAIHRFSLLLRIHVRVTLNWFEHTQVLLHNPKWAKVQHQPNSNQVQDAEPSPTWVLSHLTSVWQQTPASNIRNGIWQSLTLQLFCRRIIKCCQWKENEFQESESWSDLCRAARSEHREGFFHMQEFIKCPAGLVAALRTSSIKFQPMEFRSNLTSYSTHLEPAQQPGV